MQVSQNFERSKGNATLIFRLTSYDYDERLYQYSQTRTINNNTIYTQFEIQLNLFDDHFIDNYLITVFGFTMSYESLGIFRIDKQEKYGMGFMF